MTDAIAHETRELAAGLIAEIEEVLQQTGISPLPEDPAARAAELIRQNATHRPQIEESLRTLCGWRRDPFEPGSPDILRLVNIRLASAVWWCQEKLAGKARARLEPLWGNQKAEDYLLLLTISLWAETKTWAEEFLRFAAGERVEP